MSVYIYAIIIIWYQKGANGPVQLLDLILIAQYTFTNTKLMVNIQCKQKTHLSGFWQPFRAFQGHRFLRGLVVTYGKNGKNGKNGRRLTAR